MQPDGSSGDKVRRIRRWDGTMTAPVVKGWCPGALRPMLSGDGWVVRVRPPLGQLTEVQAAGIAALSQDFGSGLIDLSSRANIQIRGVTEAGHTPLIQGLRALSLTDPDAGTEARRNIVMTPFWQPGDDSHRIGADLARLLAAADAPDLTAKFGFAVDAGPVPVLRGVPADITIEHGPQGLMVRPATGGGKPVTAATAAAEAIALARWFLASDGAAEGRGRMAWHLAAGAVLPEGYAQAAGGAATTALPGPHPQGWLVALAFGQCGADTLAALSRLGPLRTTPWRMLMVEGLTARPDIPGLIQHADDPLLRVTACTGAPGCPQALQPTRPLARALAPGIAPPLHLHVSGCAKGCAHPGVAPLTLVAQPDGWALVRHGTTADTGVTLPPGPITAAHLIEQSHAPHL